MKWVVGPEYDESLFGKLGDALRNQGFKLIDKWWGVGGSQEVNQWTVSSPAGKLTIESETYIGLTVEGPTELVENVRCVFEDRTS